MLTLYSVVGFALSLLLLNGEGNTFDVEEYLIGKNYTKGNYMGKVLYVNFLKDEYTLEKRPEQYPYEPSESVALPYETYVSAFIMHDNKIQKKVTSLSDFEGFVNINTVEQAIEFVRLRTSEQTYFLFRPQIMIEVFERKFKDGTDRWLFGSCSTEFFKRHQLKNLEVEVKENFFEIKRYVVYFPWTGDKNYPKPPILYHIVEKVFENGKYLIEKRKILEGFEFNDIPYPLEPS